MPTYEYHCLKCDGTFECVQSMKDAAFEICPKDRCLRKRWGKGKVKRALGSGAGLIFKGSGFYITDYRSEGYKSAAKNDSGTTASKPADSKSDSTPKSTPAPKPESKPAPKPITGK